ncbi:MAG TPA: hypothetical protein PK414_02940 [Anaerolineales bacterium]|nr:hypothetical protein [Anaerolineales bacterium]
MKKFVVLLMVFITACSPNGQNSQDILPEMIQPATAYIDPSYPTAQANVAPANNQTMSGVEVRMDRAWMDGKNLNADICFTLPDASDWSIWSANLTYAGTLLQEYGTTLLSLQESQNGQPGLRCDTLTFVVPPDADLTNAVIAVEAIAAPPQQEEYCSLYMPKIQQAMIERGTGITVDCVDVNGVLTMQIISRPPEMSQEQAEQIVYSDEFYTVRGPWSFPFNLSQ